MPDNSIKDDVCMHFEPWEPCFIPNLPLIFSETPLPRFLGFHARHSMGFSSSLFAFFRDEQGEPRTARDDFGMPPVKAMDGREFACSLAFGSETPGLEKAGGNPSPVLFLCLFYGNSGVNAVVGRCGAHLAAVGRCGARLTRVQAFGLQSWRSGWVCAAGPPTRRFAS